MLKLNNKGFTLIELLAVLVILIAITSIAIPTISSSMERTKEKQNKAKIEVLESTAELYVADNKNKVYSFITNEKTTVTICLSALEEYLPDDALKDANGDEISGYIEFTTPNGYEFKKEDNIECDISQ